MSQPLYAGGLLVTADHIDLRRTVTLVREIQRMELTDCLEVGRLLGMVEEAECALAAVKRRHTKPGH